MRHDNIRANTLYVPEQTASLCCNEVHAVLMGPIIDLQLFLQADPTKNNYLDAASESLPSGIDDATHLKPFDQIDCDLLPRLTA